MPIILTKTDFILYRECPNNVWIKKNRREEYDKFEISEFEKSLGVMGNEVEELARGMFPDGYLIERRSEGAQELTRKLISKKTPIIFQAVFETDKYLAATDILKWNESAQKYDIYEIKMSSTEEEDNGNEQETDKPRKVNKKKELQYEYDLAFQSNVLEICGVALNKKYLIRLNRKYIRDGELDFMPNKLFIIEDKTEAVENLQPIAVHEMEQVSVYLNNQMPFGPCPCYYRGRNSQCTAFSIINPSVPAYGVHDLNRIGSSKKYLTELLDAGILKIEDVPEDERLKLKKLNQVLVHKSQKPMIDYAAIKAELDSLVFPLYFLDYETYPTAIPPYDGYHPYQHIVFQYSLHVLQKNLELTHFDRLILDGDPSERIAKSLREHIGDTGTIISWYKNFENSRNRELADLLPGYKDFFLDLIVRTYDLMDIVEKQYYVHPGFKGRSSIKNVGPVLAPEVSYKKLGVKSGTDAIEAYRQITKGELIGEQAKEKELQMLEYCKLDTFAMYRIWKFLEEIIN